MADVKNGVLLWPQTASCPAPAPSGTETLERIREAREQLNG